VTPNSKRLSFPPSYSFVNVPAPVQIDAALTELIDRLAALYDTAPPGNNAEELRRCTRLAHLIRRLTKQSKE
jgi:hypothetical protein